ncbi:MAG: hypothetical protein ACYDDC_09255 [Thermoplasmataceae archaeon]
MKSETFYKITNPDGTAFHDGKTKYVVGKTVRKKSCENPELCSPDVIHASRTIMDALRYAEIPMAIHKVSGTPVVEGGTKCGFFALKVMETLPESEYDNLLGFHYHEAYNPVNPMKIVNEIIDTDKENLKKWDSVGTSVWASIYAYIGSLFPGITTWKYMDAGSGYPFQSAVDLWKRGFVPVRYQGKWHLYGWRNGNVVSLWEAGF